MKNPDRRQTLSIIPTYFSARLRPRHDRPQRRGSCAVRVTGRLLVLVNTILWTCCLSTTGLQADGAVVDSDRGAAGLARELKRLQTTGSVLHIVAHPDDEDGPLLAYCARGLGARTLLFSITRGEGGANLISSDFFDDLGALRTLEHAKSAGYYGNELFYSRATDYGFSKTLQEANRTWNNGHRILADLVEVVRRERPTIILSRFRGDERDGHGHHQMAGVLSRRAFRAAADSQQFPDQLQRNLYPWQVRKLYANNIRPRRRSEDADAWTIALPTGQFDPLLGMSYAQLARYGLGFQRSQGISGHASAGGPRESYYRLLRTAPGVPVAKRETDLFAGLDTSVSGIAAEVTDPPAELVDRLQRIQGAVTEATDAFDPSKLDECVAPLVKGLRATRELIAALPTMKLRNHQASAIRQALNRKAREFQRSLELSLAMELEAWATRDNATSNRFAGDESGFRHATPDQTFWTQVHFVQRSSIPVHIRHVQVEAPEGWQVESVSADGQPVGYNDVRSWRIKTRTGVDSQPTRQTWQRDSIESPFYEVDAEQFRQRPLPTPPLHVHISVRVLDEEIGIRRVVQLRFRHPEYGHVRYPLTVVPDVSVRFPQSRGIVPAGGSAYRLDVIVRSDAKQEISGQLHLKLPSDWTSEPLRQAFEFGKEGEERRFTFRVQPAANASDSTAVIRARVTCGRNEASLGFKTISARDLSRLNLFREATHHVRVVSVVLTHVPHVGYITGSGDEVPQSLAMLGIPVEFLAADDLASGDLSAYDVILVGVRAYAVREDLARHNRRLLDYVERGGVLIVQYQTPEFDKNLGPYPYVMGRNPEEVSEEDSPVTILEPQHTLFQEPNRIDSSDFDGWVEQRGSKFWRSWDNRYTALLECHDQGQEPQRGGMLIARYGKGVYIYSAYAWYRQLPHGVSGAYRLMANMLCLRPESTSSP